MNKKLFSIGVFAAAIMLFIFGAGSALTLTTQADEPVCGDETSLALTAGQTIDIGSTIIANDAGNLIVTLAVQEGWQLGTTHVHVGLSPDDFPLTKSGKPKLGHFDYKYEYDPALPILLEHELELPDLTMGDEVFVAVHVEMWRWVEGEEGPVFETESGWAEGLNFSDHGRATYFEYTVQICEVPWPPTPPGSETVFAGGGSFGLFSTCFIDPNMGFNQWGWTNGPLGEGEHIFDIYAGATGCNWELGTFVGTLTVNYDEDAGTATVTYAMTPGSPYSMSETHLYVGSEMLPQINDDYTVDFDQYPYWNNSLTNVTTHLYTVDDLSGDIYVVAHATVGGFPQ